MIRKEGESILSKSEKGGESRIVVSADQVGPPRIVGILGRRSSWAVPSGLSASNASCDIMRNSRKGDTKITILLRLLNTISKFDFFNVYNLPRAIRWQ